MAHREFPVTSSLNGQNGGRPRLLDLFSGAGGAAMGYARAGFDVVGIDIEWQKHYPFQFRQGDAIEYLRWQIDHPGEFVAIHASPPCQDWSSLSSVSGLHGTADLLFQTLALLSETNLPWIVENVVGAPLPNQATLDGRHGVELCGTMFGLQVLRHRLFESNVPIRHVLLHRWPRRPELAPPRRPSRVPRRWIRRPLPHRDGYRLDATRRTRPGHPARLHRMARRRATGSPSRSRAFRGFVVSDPTTCDAVRPETYRPFEGPPCKRCDQSEQDCAWLLGCCGECTHWTYYDDAGNPVCAPANGRPRKPREHGTERGFEQHRYDGTAPCAECRWAHRQHRAQNIAACGEPVANTQQEAGGSTR